MGTGDASSRGADKGLVHVASIGDNHTKEALADASQCLPGMNGTEQ